MAHPEISPVTGIIAEEQVFVDFGEHEGKSILEIADEVPDFYEYLQESKQGGKCIIRRSKDKIFRLYVSQNAH